MEESEETLKARYQILLRQREKVLKKAAEANAAAAYMEQKLKHYEDILAGLIPDNTNPDNWISDAPG